jgi:three-Cys-motif partner protein
MLDAYLDHEYGDQIRQPVNFVFIEKEAQFVEQLRREVDQKDLASSAGEVEIRHGLFADEFPDSIAALKSRYGRMPATFAFIDPFGLKDNTLDLTSGLAIEQRCETLVYLPTGFMARFESTHEFAPALDRLFGGRDSWIAARDISDGEARREWLRDRFGEVLAAQTGGTCLTFDIRPQASTNIYSLVFSSQNRVGVQRMKEAMWKVDPVSGQFFRGGKRKAQAENLFDIGSAVGSGEDSDAGFSTHLAADEPDFGLLEKELRRRFGSEPFRIEQAADFTLFETVFRDDAHLKRPVLGKLEKAGRLRVISSPREQSRPGGYPDGSLLQFIE